MSGRAARVRAAADAWAEIYGDPTPRRVEVACPTPEDML